MESRARPSVAPRSRSVLPLCALLALLATHVASAQRDNVLLIVADDLGVDTLASYGIAADPPPTPNLDALAASGVLFRNAYSNPLCSPTRATILTGRYSFRTGVGFVIFPDSSRVLSLEEVTMPEVFGATDYRTALIGKWHLGNQRNGGQDGPNLAGWSHFEGMLEWGTFDYFFWLKTIDGVSSFANSYTTTDLVDSTLRWIESVNGPWVCTVALNAPHLPLHKPPRHLHTQTLSGPPSLTPVAHFRAMVEAMDSEIGRLLGSLDPAVRARTNVIFVADNGTDGMVVQPPTRRERAKFTLYEGGIHVPCIVSGPAVRSPGREEHALVTTADLFATIGELAGVDVRAIVPSHIPLDSVSVVPYLRTPGHPPLRTTAYSEQFDAPVGDNGVAIRNATHKLIRAMRGGVETEELYDLAADPFERVDLLRGPLSDAARDAHRGLSLELARLRGRAAWLPYGEGCAPISQDTGSSGERGAHAGDAPELRPARGQLPRLGASFAVELHPVPAEAVAATGVIGFLHADLDLEPYGMPGCRQLVDPTVDLPFDATPGVATWTIRIPDERAFLGIGFVQQVVLLAPDANPASLLLSNAGEAVIGFD